MNQYYVKTQHIPDVKLLEIAIYISDPQQQTGLDFISAVAKYNDLFEKIQFYVRPNVSFLADNKLTPGEARDVADWWRLAAQAVEKLPYHIKTVEDFDKVFTVKVVSKSVVIEVKEGTKEQ